MVGNALVLLAVAVGIAFRFFDNPAVLEGVTWGLAIYMLLVAAEIVLNFVLNLYRPRRPGAQDASLVQAVLRVVAARRGRRRRPREDHQGAQRAQRVERIAGPLRRRTLAPRRLTAHLRAPRRGRRHAHLRCGDEGAWTRTLRATQRRPVARF